MLRSSDDATPEVTISLAGPDATSFLIEELTFNPFIRLPARSAIPKPVEIWMELLLRRIDTTTREVVTPEVILEFSPNSIDSDGPTCTLPDVKPASAVEHDMNYVLHSDIWYSFVQTAAGRHEFMEKGYRFPIRILYYCERCRSHQLSCPHITSVGWITGGNAFFDREPFRELAQPLLQEITDFNNAVHRRTDEQLEPMPIGVNPLADSLDLKILRPKNRRRFAPVCFEKPASSPVARFALRRLPWIADPTAPHTERLFGISYGGTATIRRHDSNYRLHPMLFSSADSKTVEPDLKANEAVRFWTRWNSPSALRVHEARDRLGFAYSLHIVSPVTYLNSFLRMPPGFAYVGGGVTEYKTYSVPPRLFFLWDRSDPEQCLMYSREFPQSAGAEATDLFAEFQDTQFERRRLVDIFVYSVLLNGVVALFVNDVYSSKSLALEGRPLHVWLGSMFAMSVLLPAIVRSYRGKLLRNKALAVALLPTSFALGLILDVLPILGWIAVLAFGALTAGVFRDKFWNPSLLPRSAHILLRQQDFLRRFRSTALERLSDE